MNGLRYAITKGDVMQLNDLIGRGVDLNIPVVIEDDRSYTVREETPLIVASRLGHEKVVRMLIQNGAHVNCITLGTGMTALHWACVRGHVNIVRLLLISGANVNQVDYVYETPLLEAICGTRLEIVKMLITCGADMNSPINSSHDSSLLFAFQTRQRHISRFLIAAGADITKVNNFGEDILGIIPHMTRDLCEVSMMYQFVLDAGFRLTPKHLQHLRTLFPSSSPTWLSIFESIRQCLHVPRTLQLLCSSTIRTCLVRHTGGLCILSHCYRLPLPYSLQKYIAMGEEIDMFCLK